MEQLLIEFNKLSLEVCFYIMHFLKQYSNIVKELVHALAVRILSYGYIWEVWRALKKLQLLSAAPQATLKADLHGTTLSHAINLRQVYNMNRFV